MYNFFREGYYRYIQVSEDDIRRIENTLGIVFPDVLRKYYLEHNGRPIHTVHIQRAYDDGMGDITGIDEILPLTSDDEFNVECIKKEELNEPWNRVSPNLIPFAINEGGDYYYWDTKDGKVYISFNADEDENGMEIPYYVCSSVDELFRLMNEAYEKECQDD